MGEIVDPTAQLSWGYVVIQESSWCWHCRTLLTSQGSRWHPTLTISSSSDGQQCLERWGSGDDKIEGHFKGFLLMKTICSVVMSMQQQIKRLQACKFINYLCELGYIILPKEVFWHWLNDMWPHAHNIYETHAQCHPLPRVNTREHNIKNHW